MKQEVNHNKSLPCTLYFPLQPETKEKARDFNEKTETITAVVQFSRSQSVDLPVTNTEKSSEQDTKDLTSKEKHLSGHTALRSGKRKLG